jgi:hypothetical protein
MERINGGGYVAAKFSCFAWVDDSMQPCHSAAEEFGVPRQALHQHPSLCIAPQLVTKSQIILRCHRSEPLVNHDSLVVAGIQATDERMRRHDSGAREPFPQFI